jgi:hypothetical protein
MIDIFIRDYPKLKLFLRKNNEKSWNIKEAKQPRRFPETIFG